ncbi:GNAT family N-acetyltransferase [Streptacidiphilus sp. MAP5-3]|uniref:GNAT family N-acetyltransferase n=1 Tax=unclassified Streptacidiphilus TaxID=2643834 RepID=UPI0035178320
MSAYEPMPFHLETERLILELGTGADAEELCALVGERESDGTTVERARAYIEEARVEAAKNGFALLHIRRRDEGDFIGYCGLLIGRGSPEEPEIGYELFKRVHGNGYATEAARVVVEAAAATGRQRLWATVGGWNAPSFRVLEKVGFERDHVTLDEKGRDRVWMTRTLP